MYVVMGTCLSAVISWWNITFMSSDTVDIHRMASIQGYIRVITLILGLSYKGSHMDPIASIQLLSVPGLS